MAQQGVKLCPTADFNEQNEWCTLSYITKSLPPVFLTVGFPLLVEQYALHRSPDQHRTTCLLNNWDDVKGNLTGAPPWIVSATLVVVKKESIDEKAGLFRRDA